MRARASGAEADAQVVALGAEVDDLREVHTHRPLLAVELVPPVLAEALLSVRSASSVTRRPSTWPP